MDTDTHTLVKCKLLLKSNYTGRCIFYFCFLLNFSFIELSNYYTNTSEDTISWSKYVYLQVNKLL